MREEQSGTPAVDLTVSIGNLALSSPVMTASGTFGYGREFEGLADLSRLGAVVVKGISLEPSSGNPPPRIVETSCGMLNAIGLENVGADVFLEKKMPFLRRIGVPVVVNIYGKAVEEYARLAERLDEVPGVSALEVNISCPNVSAGGIAFGTDPEMAASVISAVRKNTGLPVIAKLSPNVTDITVIAKAVEAAGADAVSLINTLTGMVVDVHRRAPMLANITGGLSGPAIRPVAVRMVWQTAGAVSIPVIGIGGILTARDALEFLIAGAAAVQVGTASFIQPDAVDRVREGIASYLRENGFAAVRDIIGSLRLPAD